MSEEGPRLWAVKGLFEWGTIKLVDKVSGRKVPVALDNMPGTVGFMPVFGDRDAALAFADGRYDVQELATERIEEGAPS